MLPRPSDNAAGLRAGRASVLCIGAPGERLGAVRDWRGRLAGRWIFRHLLVAQDKSVHLGCDVLADPSVSKEVIDPSPEAFRVIGPIRYRTGELGLDLDVRGDTPLLGGHRSPSGTSAQDRPDEVCGYHHDTDEEKDQAQGPYRRVANAMRPRARDPMMAPAATTPMICGASLGRESPASKSPPITPSAAIKIPALRSALRPDGTVRQTIGFRSRRQMQHRVGVVLAATWSNGSDRHLHRTGRVSAAGRGACGRRRSRGEHRGGRRSPGRPSRRRGPRARSRRRRGPRPGKGW